MRKLCLTAGIFFIFLLLPGCGRDLEQAKRYSEMISDCDSLIAQTNIIIKYNRNKADNLNATRNAELTKKAGRSKSLKLEQELINATEIASDFEKVKAHIEAIKIFAAIGEKVNKRIIFFKRKYINYSTSIQIHDENVMIREITNGLSTEQYISKNIPVGLK